jgi:hypothetical protein
VSATARSAVSPAQITLGPAPKICDDSQMRPTSIRAPRWSALSFICATIGIALPNCNTDDPHTTLPDATTTPDATALCHDLASAYCAKFAACDPVVTRQAYGNVATCVAREMLYCLAVAGTGWPSNRIEQCAQGIKTSTSCYERYLNRLTGCELVPGTLPSGTRCDSSSQCASLSCPFAVSTSPDGGSSAPLCGRCEGPDAGPPRCGDGDACPSPQRCLYDRGNTKQRCVVPQPEGAQCVSTDGCEDGLFCLHPAPGAETWICVRQGGPGAACTDYEGCDTKAGLRCISGVCGEPTFVPVGAECDYAGKLCGDEARCIRPLPIPIPPAPPGIPTCQGPIEDGSPCDDALSPCRVGALCRAGQCRLSGDPQCR